MAAHDVSRGRSLSAAASNVACQERLDEQTIIGAIGGAKPMSTNYAFEPETVAALATAFHAAWGVLLEDPHLAELGRPILRRRLTACLMQLAADGEHDSVRLASGAVRRLCRKTQSVRVA